MQLKLILRNKGFATFLNFNCDPSKIYSQQKHDLLHYFTSNVLGSEKNFDCQRFTLNLEVASNFLARTFNELVVLKNMDHCYKFLEVFDGIFHCRKDVIFRFKTLPVISAMQFSMEISDNNLPFLY